MEKILELQFIDVENNEIVKSSEFQSEDEIRGTVLEFEHARETGNQLAIFDDRDRWLNCQYQRTEEVVEGDRKIYKLYVKVKVEEPVEG